MPLSDSPELRETLKHLFPAITIERAVPTPSGQRLVYFCSFSGQSEVPAQQDWHRWGPVVLKLTVDVHPSVIARLEKELSILHSLRSDYYPRPLYFDPFIEDPITEEKFPHRLFVTIEERIEGLPLSACRDRFCDEAAIVVLLTKLVQALRLLWEHQQKIVHRDLKPDNILIRRNGDPVVIDLGILREEGSAGITESSVAPGPCTALYASPEQAKNEKRFISFKSDLFALGVIAYELLVGSHPFSNSPLTDSRDEVLARVVREHPPSVHSLGKGSVAFSEFLERLMAKEPYQRYRTVEGVLADLRRLTGGAEQ